MTQDGIESRAVIRWMRARSPRDATVVKK
jgi:hypothetical protein